jgi:hypothetical protein
MGKDILDKQQAELEQQLAAEAAQRAAEQRRRELAKNAGRNTETARPARGGNERTWSTNTRETSNQSRRWTTRTTKATNEPTTPTSTGPGARPSTTRRTEETGIPPETTTTTAAKAEKSQQAPKRDQREPTQQLTPNQLRDPKSVDWSKLTPYEQEVLRRVEFRESRAKDEILGMDRAGSDADRDALGRAATGDVDLVKRDEGRLRYTPSVRRDKVKEALTDINRFQYRMEPKLEKEKDETKDKPGISWLSLDRKHPPTKADEKRLMDVFHAEDRLGHKLGRDAIKALDLGDSPIFGKHPAFKEALGARDHVTKEWGNEMYVPKAHVLGKDAGLGQSMRKPKGLSRADSFGSRSLVDYDN